MSKPILQPGRPGDLLLILQTALDETKRLKECAAAGEQADDAAHGVAVATLEALCMWLGIAEVPSVPEIH